jgi:hypothetical protein
MAVDVVGVVANGIAAGLDAVLEVEEVRHFGTIPPGSSAQIRFGSENCCAWRCASWI